MQLAQESRRRERGFAMAALLVAMAVMAIVLSMLLPVWRTLATREKEEELMWRGQQYDRAVQLYRKKNAAPGAPNVDALVKGRFLRRAYKDPITSGDFELVGVNAGIPNAPGVQRPQRGFGQLIGGVRSKSTARSFNEPDGATTYDKWTFTYTPWKSAGQATVPGAGATVGTGPGTGPGSRGGGRGAGRRQGRGTGPGRGPSSGGGPPPGGGQGPRGFPPQGGSGQGPPQL
jgi:type II secretory pathway pseudopilin PulG